MTASNPKPSFASIAAIGTDITVNPVPQPDPASIISASSAPTKSFSEIQQQSASAAISSEDVKQRVNTTAKAHRMNLSSSAFAISGSSSASSTAASMDGHSTSTASSASGGNLSPVAVPVQVPAVSVAKLAPAPLKNPWKTESIKKELSIVMQSQPGLPTPAESKDMRLRPSLPVRTSASVEPVSALVLVAPREMREALTVGVAAAVAAASALAKPSSTPAKAITSIKPKSTKPAWKKPDIIETKIDLRQEAKAPVKPSSEATKDEPTQASSPSNSDSAKQQQSLRNDKPKESSKPVPVEAGKKDADVDAAPSSKTTSPSNANTNASASSAKNSALKKNGRESLNKNGNNASSSDSTRRPHNNNNNKSTKKSSSSNSPQDHTHSHSSTHKNNNNKSKKSNSNSNPNNQKKNKNKKQGKRKNKVKKQKDVHYIPTPEEYEALKKSAVQQVEYFFSVDELIKNIYLRKQMDVEGYLPAAIVFNFPTVLSHYIPYYDLMESVQESEVVEVDLTNECLRLKGGEEACKKWLFPNKDGTLGVAKWIKDVVESETEDTNAVLVVEDVSTKESSEDASEAVEQESTQVVSEKSIDEEKATGANDKPELTMTDSDESEISQ
uniref:HTH La-type RNA-binding domain-containing protein n=1 Tax=Chaetoceros debilis TaxID=122233 RepID=A0A7S3V7T2_9STRA